MSVSKSLQVYINDCKNAEDEVLQLTARFNNLKSFDADIWAQESDNKDLKDLISENKKLKYRIGIMKRALEEHEKKITPVSSSSKSIKKDIKSPMKEINKSPSLEEFDLSSNHMVNILGYTEALFRKAVIKICPEAPSSLSVQMQVSKMADYQCNVAMSLAKIMKKNPREVGQLVVDSLDQSPVLSKLEVSGPGFINIYLNQEFIKKQIANLIKNGVTPPSVKKQHVVVDFSSPNIAKEMHVGHLRSTIIGDSVCRLLEFLGHSVLRLNHLGDWGTQFGMLIAHLKDRFPNYVTQSPPINDLQAFYKESKLRFDEDPEFKKRAYEAVVKLQSKEPSHYKAWQLICDVSLKEFEKVYSMLKVSIIPRGESFYQERMEKLIVDLDKAGLLSLEDGRKVMYADDADIPLTVTKSDGGFTYDTSDLACIRQRVEEEKADWIIYITDAGQAQHFKSILACARRAGFVNPSKVRVDHVTFGVVLGEDKKKFKTRSGDTVRLKDLLNEGVERSEEKLKEKDRISVLSEEEVLRAKEAVAFGCIKYADLMHDRTRDYVFSFDRMLDFRGNTAAYLLYALTRIRSIARNAGISRDSLLSEISSEDQGVHLDHEKEWKLAKTLLKLPDVIVKLTQDLYIHPLCEFLYEISTTFTEFYNDCYCIEKDSSGNVVKINTNRLLLSEATSIVMEKCFDILGIETLEKM